MWKERESFLWTKNVRIQVLLWKIFLMHGIECEVHDKAMKLLRKRFFLPQKNLKHPSFGAVTFFPSKHFSSHATGMGNWNDFFVLVNGMECGMLENRDKTNNE